MWFKQQEKGRVYTSGRVYISGRGLITRVGVISLHRWAWLQQKRGVTNVKTEAMIAGIMNISLTATKRRMVVE